MHLAHRVAYRGIREAVHGRVAYQFIEPGIQRIMSPEGFTGLLLRLLINLIKQATDTTQGEITEWQRAAEQGDKGISLDSQAEAVLRCAVQGAGSSLAQQSGQGEALAGADLERGIRPVSIGNHTFATDQPLLDDKEALYRAVLRLQNRLACGEEAQLGMLDQPGEMRRLHEIERRVALQEADQPLHVLHDSGFTRLGEFVVFAHGATAVVLR